ncbi:hypothetical protein [Cohnella terricola]|uniref:Uncharacterized protein n=1 Tax=Cohnella terricola TaxID=1289167 RepID=A0A559J4S2_9BACL|nr:hypothetical protein [Cohnella terricola]TVX94889.1 hypothetical protein FPZ45_24570 [Cohnella terricola]
MFILLEHSLRPLKLRGKKVTPSTIIPMHIEQLKPTEYIGIRSGKRVSALNFGGHITPDPEAKDAFYLSKVMPVTLDESALNAINGDIFVPANEACSVEILTVNEIRAINWPDSVNGYWISVSFYQNDQFKGNGWFYKNEGGSEDILLNGDLEYKGGTTIIKAIRPLFQKTVECECNGLVSKDYWDYRPDVEII